MDTYFQKPNQATENKSKRSKIACRNRKCKP